MDLTHYKVTHWNPPGPHQLLLLEYEQTAVIGRRTTIINSCRSQLINEAAVTKSIKRYPKVELSDKRYPEVELNDKFSAPQFKALWSC